MMPKPEIIIYELTGSPNGDTYLMVVDNYVVANGVSVEFMRSRMQRVINGDVGAKLKPLSIWILGNPRVTDMVELDRDTNFEELMKRFEIHKLIGD
ncbi:hypothetical protein VPNG_00073 [Vibrio phage VBP47]|uniref:Uncharacterized protein n=1 Tax=Vibrio phage VBP47 TaxID=754073 RepID=M4SL72_9CAUD|nr:hypothetical protein VPNG_00073 [Vibrio phage VBP47]AGH57097.1 hypothetical protein VPNG_00073 [Vibrio phage VBP47]